MSEIEHPLRPASDWPQGRVEIFKHVSKILADNALGDPCVRPVSVYLPPAYDESSRHYPVLWLLAAYTSSGPASLAWRNHSENLPQRLDRLIATEAMPPVICVLPDSYTALGGNQFVDSPAIGQYASHLLDELIPAIDQRYRTVAESAGRAAFGKSSGGFGALHLASHYPGAFAAIASHAGDCGFDRVYLRDFPMFCDELALHDYDLERFVRRFWRMRRPGHRAFHAMMVLCLAASYSPAMDQPMNVQLPFDLQTCVLNEEIWQQWRGFDPVNYGAQALEQLAALQGLWLDAGSRDQYFIHYGTRELHQKLDTAGISHHFEEFDGNHSGMDWRFDRSLPWLT
ncbi:MAG: alpha/beta hydrolase-fold protein, partial [Pseudomonadota bacterium]